MVWSFFLERFHLLYITFYSPVVFFILSPSYNNIVVYNKGFKIPGKPYQCENIRAHNNATTLSIRHNKCYIFCKPALFFMQAHIVINLHAWNPLSVGGNFKCNNTILQNNTACILLFIKENIVFIIS